MKYELYKKMSKAHKEEYHYKFDSPEDWHIMKWSMGVTAFVAHMLNSLLFLLFGGIFLLMMVTERIHNLQKEKWLDQHGYFEKKK